MNVLLADDQIGVREALKCLLQNECDVELSSEASNVGEMLTQLALLCPDLLLLDWELSGLGGRGIMTEIRACCPSVRVVAMSVHPEARDEALVAGVECFVSKGDPPERVIEAVRAVRAAD